jgi:exopolyphosphatase/guanosine-5'-triphosphate,3'-diphosphate pyrophosphatase
VRAAGDREEFLDRAEAAFGIRPEVISGEEEAVLGFEGATGGRAGTGPCLVIDVGGGSTEFVFGSGRPEVVASVDLGSRRVTERFLAHHPCLPGELAEARRAAAAAFAGVVLPALPSTVVGLGGTFTSQAALHLGLKVYDSARVHGTVVTQAALDTLAERLATMSLEEIAGLPSLDPVRAPVLLGGAVASAEALRRSGTAEVVVSEADLLDGIARRLALV